MTRLGMLLAGAMAASALAELPAGMRHVGTAAHKHLNEMSGVSQSRRWPGVYWVHNDSGDDPRVFAVDATGKVIIPDWLQDRFHGEEKVDGKKPWSGLEVLLSVNQDWEDITVDENYLYIADVGNNANDRRDLGVYVLTEPNPYERRSARILKYLPVRYPEQRSFPAEIWHYDCESLFVSDGKLYFITKHRQPGQHDEYEQGANLYRLDTTASDQLNVLTLVDSHPLLTLITGADVSADGQHLAVISSVGVWVFNKPEAGDAWFSSVPRGHALSFRDVRQLEAITWQDENTLLVTNEQRDIFTVDVAKLPRLEPPKLNDRR